MNRLKLITLILLTFTLNVCAQNYIIRQDSLRASEAATKLHLKNAIKDSLDANARGWQTEAQVRQIAGDSSQVAETRAKNYTDTQFNTNPKGWQTASQVRSIVGDSSNVLRGLINSGAGLDTNAVRNIAKQIAGDSAQVAETRAKNYTDQQFNANPKGWRTQAQAKADAIDTLLNTQESTAVNDDYVLYYKEGSIKKLKLSNLPVNIQLGLIYNELVDSINNLRASIGGYSPTYPLPVSNLTATAGNNIVTLNWVKPAQSDSVLIERASSQTGGTVFIFVAYVTASQYIDGNVINNNTYTYRLRNYYGGFASSPVTINATPTEPITYNYFTITPTSINFNNIDGRETGTVGDAEDGNLSFFDSLYQVYGNIQATQTDKIHGNYGYKFTSNGDTLPYVWARKPISYSDSICVRFTLKLPTDYPLSDTTVATTYKLFGLMRNNSTENIELGYLTLRLSSTIHYLYRIGFRHNGTTVTYTLSSPVNIPLNEAVTLEYRYVQGNGTGRVTVLFDNSVIFDTTGLINNDYSIGYARFGNYNISGKTRMGEYYIIDDIKISRQPIGLYSATPYTAIVTVKNDSSFARSTSINVSYPFSIKLNNQEISTLTLDPGESVQLVAIVDTSVVPGTYNGYLLFDYGGYSSSIQLTYYKSGPSGNEGDKAWYVYKYATGLNNGTSWTNAWTSFSSIDWNSMNSGDTLYISGGADSLVYTENITPAKKGITITKGLTSGHNGRVIIKSPDTGSGIAINIRNIDSISVVGLEFQDWFECVKWRSDNIGAINFGMMKDCKGITYGWVSEAVSGVANDTAANRIRNIWYINNDFTSPGFSTYQTEFGSFGGVRDVFFIGNKWINRNNNPNSHDDFIQGVCNMNFYFINNFFRHDTTVTKTGNANGLGGMSNSGGDWFFINNILIEPPTSIGYPLMMFYRPLGSPSNYWRNWSKMTIIGNTFGAAHPGMIRLGYDSMAVIKNNIFYSSPEWILYNSTSAGRTVFIAIDECESIPNQYLRIENNGFYNNYTTASYPNGVPGVVYLGCSNPPTMPTSNLRYDRNSTTLYSPFNSNFRMGSTNSEDFKIPSTSSAKDNGQSISGLTMHPSALSIIDPVYKTPLSNYRNSGKNLVQWYVERDFNGNLRGVSWDIGAYEYVP